MLRLRRYRVFLIVAVLTTLIIYHFTHVQNWDAATLERLTKLGSHDASKGAGTESDTDPSVGDYKPAQEPEANTGVPVTSQPVPEDVVPNFTSPKTLSSTSTVLDVGVPTTASKPPPAESKEDEEDPDTEPAIPAQLIKEQFEFGQHGQGPLEAVPFPTGTPPPHWEKQTEHFPIPPGSMIPLPTGKAKSIPKIQQTFKTESAEAQIDRERKLARIKAAFEHAWGGYKEFAIPHDELKPLDGEFKDPFNGWGATLVDTLDTLWMMGLKDDFELALLSVKNIDFTTSARKDIPLFETVIRYLGGLVSAYDISLSQYPILLEKAKELADILMGAFDTPNRMPVTYYNWAPSYASQPHRASTRVVMAELGSLVMEFTRLAQITRQDKYYDAVARITDELEIWQNKTRLPGLWPVHLDASGCKKPKKSYNPVKQSTIIDDPLKEQKLILAGDTPGSLASKDPVSQQKDGTSKASGGTIEKRQLDDAGLPLKSAPTKTTVVKDAKAGTLSIPEIDHTQVDKDPEARKKQLDEVDCLPQGLASPPYATRDTFSLGAMADSTFEYLPKMHMLLGGNVDQYQSMYEYAMNTAREHLLFRPMTNDGSDLLFSGKLTTAGKQEEFDEDGISTQKDEPKFEAEGAHLTCFAGGMFAVGAKVFGIDSDMEIAKKLTEGCVWAYESTTTGIMPEEFTLVPCESTKSCPWDPIKWWDALDPHGDQRIARIKDWNEKQRALAEQLAAEETKAKLAEIAEIHEPELVGAVTSGNVQNIEYTDTDEAEVYGKSLKKRQAGKSSIQYKDETTASTASSDNAVTGRDQPTKTTTKKVYGDGPNEVEVADTDAVMKSFFTPQPIVSHEEYATRKIEEQRLPDGFVDINSKHYILRPEAIESVFIMYRITGDSYWREKGWKMFTAVEKYTRTEFGNSAIRDVTSAIPEYENSMESFWLAETLKYFFLLFSEESVVSLDDWVLNTEAHPFYRPK